MAVYSVIITARDQPKLLQRAVASVKTQSFHSSQVIILSDRPGSGCFEAVAPLLSGADTFVQRAGRCGHAAARNTCLGFVEGKAFLFLDEGDAFTETFFRDLFPLLDPARAVYADYHTVVEEVRGDRSEALCAWPRTLADRDLTGPDPGGVLPTHCVIYPGWLARDLRFDESKASCTDWDYLVEARTRVTLTHAAVSGPIVYARTVAPVGEAETAVPGVEDILETSFGAIAGAGAAIAARSASLAGSGPMPDRPAPAG